MHSAMGSEETSSAMILLTHGEQGGAASAAVARGAVSFGEPAVNFGFNVDTGGRRIFPGSGR